MHLQAIRIRGFKSFVDPIELKLEPGVAVVVGPNGSGKSNVADAIVWAAGSLTPSELRAEKPDDVLFGGSSTRQAADHCEVELLFDNEDGGFGEEIDFSEISITRRLVRGGEGQYLVNKAAVRRTDLVELLADVGLGGSMHSIVSQGKVDAVLASRPEDRRHLVEEAAGLGKFKRRKHRAELKLARVATQVERAKDVEDEVRKRLRPLALQATAAERAEKLAVEIAALRARVAQLDLEAVAERRAAAEERRDAVAIARRSSQEKLAALLEERQQAEDELSDAAGGREAALGALYRLQGASERLALRRESAAGSSSGCARSSPRPSGAAADRNDEAVRALEAAAATAAATARDAAERHGQAAERARLAHSRLAAYERRLAADGRRDARRPAHRARRRRGSARRGDRRPGGRQRPARRTGGRAGAAGPAPRVRDDARRKRRARARGGTRVARRGDPSPGGARTAGERGRAGSPCRSHRARRRGRAGALGPRAPAGARARARGAGGHSAGRARAGRRRERRWRCRRSRRSRARSVRSRRRWPGAQPPCSRETHNGGSSCSNARAAKDSEPDRGRRPRSRRCPRAAGRRSPAAGGARRRRPGRAQAARGRLARPRRAAARRHARNGDHGRGPRLRRRAR